VVFESFLAERAKESWIEFLSIDEKLFAKLIQKNFN